MNKSRVEAFTDAVLAIILTIMILEVKTPESTKLSAILPQVPYLISYAIGYLFIGTAWYNHHYMFAKAKVITRKIYWANNFWMFTTSFLPVATAWIGEHINARGPQIFYTIVYVTWAIAYAVLSKRIADDNAAAGHAQVAESIRQMRIYRFLLNWKLDVAQMVLVVLVLIFLPAAQLLFVFLQIVLVGAHFNEDSDKLFS